MLNIIRQRAKGGGGLALLTLVMLLMTSVVLGGSAEGATVITIPDDASDFDKAFKKAATDEPGISELTIRITAPLTGVKEITLPLEVYSKDISPTETKPDPDGTISKLKIEGSSSLTAATNNRLFNVTSGTELTVDSGVILKGDGSANSGGVVINAGNATFSGVVFNDNSSSSNGGAVEISNSGTATFTGVTFEKNKATGNGGAISVNGGTIKFDGAVSTFEGNSAGSGGALYISSGGNITFGDNPTLNFKHNCANSDYGGAIYSANDFLMPTNVGFNFEGNYAKYGGAIASKSLTINKNTPFDGNTASQQGGAIYATGTVTIGNDVTPDMLFIRSEASFDGGAIHGSVVIVNGSPTFSYNNVTANNSAGGGAIYASERVELAGGPKFERNTSTKDGGAICIADNGIGENIISGRPTFEWNTSKGNGGAIYVGTTIRISGKETSFSHNSSLGHGGAIYVGKDAFNVVGSFAHNNAGILDSSINDDADGGAIYCKDGTVKVDGAKFEVENTAKHDGGAIYAFGAIETKNGASFAHQVAGRSGGALYTAKTVDISDSTFDDNHTEGGFGGAIYIANDKGTALDRSTIYQSRFTSNNAGGSGGAVNSNSPGTLAVENSSFSGNGSTNNGGAIACDSGTLDVKSSYFHESNYANGSEGGGAIHVTLSCNLKVSSSFFSGNRASPGNGGAIAAINIEEMSILRSSFFNNHALQGGNGGAIYSNVRNFKVAHCTFYDNDTSTLGFGGALFLDPAVNNPTSLVKEESILMYNTFYKNTSGTGGGICTSTKILYLMGNFIHSNTASLAADIYGEGGQGSIYSYGYNMIGVYGQDGSASESSWGYGNKFAPGMERSKDKLGFPSTAFYFTGEETDESTTIGSTSDPVNLKVYRPDENLQGTPLVKAISREEQGMYYLPAFGNDITDAFGKDPTNGNRNDIGARQVSKSDGGSEDDDLSKVVDKITIGGVPNSLTAVGQTVRLFVNAYNAQGQKIDPAPDVNWVSKYPDIASFSSSNPGRLTAWNTGETEITAYLKSNPSFKNSVTLKVMIERDEDDLNIARELWEYAADVASDASASFVRPSAKLIDNNAEFSRKFSSYPAKQMVSPDIIDAINVVHATGSYSPDGDYKAKTGFTATLSPCSSGNVCDVLPIEVTWIFTGDETDLEKLFANRRVDMTTETGKIVNIIRPASSGSNSAKTSAVSGITAAEAAKAGVLTLDSSSDGSVSVRLRTYLADVNGDAQLINANGMTQQLLIVPDGKKDDNKIEGTIWLAEIPSSDDSGSGGNSEGGGGGCTVGFSGLALLLAATVLLKRK